jgi:hypothetical protein
MLMFPLEFVPVKYPGYMWNVKDSQLYTYKLGCLRALPVQLPRPWNHAQTPYYSVSHLGKRRRLYVSELQTLSQGYDVYTVPVLGPNQATLFD